MLAALAYQAAEQQADLEQQPHRHREHGLGEDVRRGQDHADHETADDHVRADLLQVLDVDHSDPDQQHRGHRDLEGDAEGEEQSQDEVQVAVDVRHHRHALGRHAGEEVEDHREHQEVGEGHPGVEQDDAGHQQRQRHAFLVLVQAGRDEAPDLREDHRHGEEQRHHHGQLERREERRGDVGGDHAGAFRKEAAQRLGDQGVDLLREVEQAGEDQEDRRHAAQQARTQFGQVRDQGHFLVVLGLLGFIGAHGLRGVSDGGEGGVEAATAGGAAASAGGTAGVLVGGGVGTLGAGLSAAGGGVSCGGF